MRLGAGSPPMEMSSRPPNANAQDSPQRLRAGVEPGCKEAKASTESEQKTRSSEKTAAWALGGRHRDPGAGLWPDKKDARDEDAQSNRHIDQKALT
jgi:hypothetical protein